MDFLEKQYYRASIPSLISLEANSVMSIVVLFVLGTKGYQPHQVKK